MSRRWVLNASPLILLGKVGRLGLLPDLTDELMIPEAVAREVGAKPDGARVMGELASMSTTRIVSVADIPTEVEAPAASSIRTNGKLGRKLPWGNLLHSR